MGKFSWGTFRYDGWEFYLVASGKGLCYVGIGEESIEEALEWLEKKEQDVEFTYDEIAVSAYKEALFRYMIKEQREFNMPIQLIGTDFQVAVWSALLKIPYGETVSYECVARNIARPKAVRAVGNAIGKNPLLIVVPCHRVIKKDGSLGGFSSGLDVKRNLHEIEGIQL